MLSRSAWVSVRGFANPQRRDLKSREGLQEGMQTVRRRPGHVDQMKARIAVTSRQRELVQLQVFEEVAANLGKGLEDLQKSMRKRKRALPRLGLARGMGESRTPSEGWAQPSVPPGPWSPLLP